MSDAQIKRLKKRARVDKRFKIYGQATIVFSLLMLFVLVGSITSRSFAAFSAHHLKFNLAISPEQATPNGRDSSGQIETNILGFYDIVTQNLYQDFGAETREHKEAIRALVNRLAVVPLAKKVGKKPSLLGKDVSTKIVLSDNIDLFLEQRSQQEFSERTKDVSAFLSKAQNHARFSKAEALFVTQGKQVTRYLPTETAAGVSWVKDWVVTAKRGEIKPVSKVYGLSLPQVNRNFSDLQYAYILLLDAQGRIKNRLNTNFFTNVDSNYPELAGILVALIGSLFLMLVTAFIAIPIGVAASVYLEEFAKPSRLNSIIEVNINNLAAVPSILFGLLGAAVLIEGFGLPRSAPIVGGIVLGLLVLPTIIIASRSALRSVPSDLRAAALAIGASKMQTVTHHVLPLAIPGVLTGAILGMARALGETAPLILIGMVAFVAQVPSGPNDAATALPVLVYRWSNLSERAWEPLTAGVIVFLLLFLVIMNLSAVFIRRYFENKKV